MNATTSRIALYMQALTAQAEFVQGLDDVLSGVFINRTDEKAASGHYTFRASYEVPGTCFSIDLNVEENFVLELELFGVPVDLDNGSAPEGCAMSNTLRKPIQEVVEIEKGESDDGRSKTEALLRARGIRENNFYLRVYLSDASDMVVVQKYVALLVQALG